MSWTWLPSLAGILLLTMGILVMTDGERTMGTVLLVLALPCFALWGVLVRREGRSS
jgi:hypothetical protein